MVAWPITTAPVTIAGTVSAASLKRSMSATAMATTDYPEYYDGT
ncbi:hypothetical protein PBI_OKIROE_59 [Mycobacterium phage OkiRoe]|nr:hypothetical protein PBI_OKIROE_59 [Mycobacterium phage OkiRoe]AHZ95620.1 hypothetical protein PBI_OKIROE_59 [Mycobacterium phage OkiRoe]